MLPPILEIYVLWHPRDEKGSEIAREFIEHFRGNSFTGLLSGAVEVFVRSAGWRGNGDAPRPIPFPGTSLPTGIEAARFIAVVPIMGMAMADAVRDPGPWRDYIEEITRLQGSTPDRIGVFPYLIDPRAMEYTTLAKRLRSYQRIAGSPSRKGETEAMPRCRDLAQGIAQQLSREGEKRLMVFISHTRQSRSFRHPSGNEGDPLALTTMIRRIIADTHLRHFFDASDLQPGDDWDEELRVKAESSALLAIRTDSYSSRKWCQRELLTAKNAGMPVVMMDALDVGEERGSFLMDHVPRIPIRRKKRGWRKESVYRALGLLVDESLKRILWRHQRELSDAGSGFDIAWWAPHAPEPLTLAHWLREGLQEAERNGTFPAQGSVLRILHPEPPLGPDERHVLGQIASLAQKDLTLDIMTPRLLAARGG
uniref:TIR domain-containing protein n=1 Tax=Candidatus Kentrum sp. LFY TaxID=2126342 RepID=A0A450V7V9_9GAMM|nr:MAG: TIR domain-containing protein [Candidatus Kentron sp. LFY]